MITQMEVLTASVTDPPIPILDQVEEKDPIQIKKITGLGPVNATINSSQYGSIDGENFDGSFTPKRNIVITAALNPDYSQGQTQESLRQILYSYFMPETKVTLRFTSTHLATVQIDGYVESCEPDLFSIDPEYIISIICPKPYFLASTATTVTGITQNFSAPVDVIVNYEGSSPTGFVVDIAAPAGTDAFTGEVRIINSTPSVGLTVVSSVPIDLTHTLRVSSVEGDKYVRQYPTSGAAPTNYLGKRTSGSTWVQLQKGNNKVQILTATAGLTWNLSYFAKYGGL